MAKKRRTYMMDESSLDFLDEMAEKHGVSKSDVVNRSLRMYNVKVINGNITDKVMEMKMREE